MCYLTYTNFQRQGAVANMTAGEVKAATKSKEYLVVLVWDHKTASSGPAKVAVHRRVHQLLLEYMGEKKPEDLVFTTTNTSEKVTHISLELDKLGDHFGKKFATSPTLHRKQMATVVGHMGDEALEKEAAIQMTHSLDVHRSAYQHSSGVEQSVKRYLHNCV